MLRLLVTRKWLFRHALLLLALATFLALGYWQLLRAGEGNARSVGYAFEWPLLAGCAIYAWVRALRYDLHPPTQVDEPAFSVQRPPSAAGALPAEEPDEEMDAYNAHLAWLHEQDQRPSR
ncbi:MAG: hypothetical protein WCB04_00100 [Mycobacteriales bacterium]